MVKFLESQMQYMPRDKVLIRFSDTKSINDGEWMARCPVHQDDKQSLHVTEVKNGTLLLKCHAGCDNRDIMTAIGLGMRDLFPPKEPNGRNNDTYYLYRDESGKVIFRTVRRNPKGFYQQRPDGQGGWINNLDGITPIPYRLSGLIKGIADGKPVYIVEGEKDAENLVRMGLIATTNHGGAGKWTEAHSKFFPAGTVVHILPDNDLPGQKHATVIAGQLTVRGCKVKIINLPTLPEKGDVSDWITQGGSAEQIEAIAANAPEWTINEPEPVDQVKVIPLSNVEMVSTTWVWLQGRLARNHVTLLAGDPGQGKSYCSISLAAAISNGNGLPVIESEQLLFMRGDIEGPQKVLILAYEDDAATIKERAIQAGANLDNVLILEGKQDETGACHPVTAGSIQVLQDTVEQYRPALVIIDPIQAFTGSRVDMHRANEVQSVMASLTDIARRYDCAVLVIAHMNKSTAQGNAMYRVIGSIAFVGAVRTAILMARDREDKDIRHLIWIKSNLAKEPEPLMATIDPAFGGWVWVGPSSAEANELLSVPFQKTDESGGTLAKAKDFLTETLGRGPVSTKKLIQDAREGWGISEKTLRRAKEQLGVYVFRNGDSWYWTQKDGRQDGQNIDTLPIDHVRPS